MTPVFAFIHEKRAEIAAMPEVKGLGEISKKGAELFKLLPEAEQAERHKRYEEEMKSYKEWQETDEGKAAMAGKESAAAEVKAAKKEKVAKKRAKLARKEARAVTGSGAAAEENLRKKPMTPVFAFIHEKRAEIAAMPEVKGLGEISKKG